MDNPFIKRFVEFIKSPSHSRTIGTLVILIIAAAVPLTVLVAQQQQQTRQSAAGCTVTTKQCANTTSYQVCYGSNGSSGWGTAITCPSGGTCSGAGNCSPCKANIKECVSTTDYKVCNISGTGWGLKTTCPTGWVCTGAGNCSAPPACLGSCQASSTYCTGGTNGVDTTGNTYCNTSTNGGHPICCKPACTSNGGTCTSPTNQGCQGYPNTTLNSNYSCPVSGQNCCVKSTTATTPPGGTNPTPAPTAGSNQCQSGGKFYASGSEICVGSPYTGALICTMRPQYVVCGPNGWSTTPFTCGTVNSNATWCKYTSGSGSGTSTSPYKTGINCLASCGQPAPTTATTPAPAPTSTTTGAWSCNSTTKTCSQVAAGTAGAYATEAYCNTICEASGTTKYYCQTGGSACAVADATTGTNVTQYADKTQCDTACIFGGGGGGGGGGGNCGSLPCCNTDPIPQGPCSGGRQQFQYYQSSTGLQCQPVAAPSQTCSTGGIPDCNQSQAYGVGIPDCSQAVCTASPANACGTGSGTQTCKYTLHGGSTYCNPQNVTQTCNANCSGTNVCKNGTCQTQNTPTPTPSGSPNPTATPAPGDTQLAVTVGLDAIGSTGDNVNHDPSSSNKNPLTTNRNLELWVFDTNNNQISDKVGSIDYNTGTGLFTGTVNLGQGFTTGSYTIKIMSDGHLVRLVSGIQSLTAGQTNQVPRVNLIAGDIDKNNTLNINDYNILLSCVTDADIVNIDNHALCNTNASYLKLSDLEDSGVVNKFDYNLFLREYSVQNGD